MAEAVLDTSAVLAVLLDEPGADQIAAIMPRSLVSVANEAEVVTVLVRNGAGPEAAVQAVLSLAYDVVELDAGLARRAGMLGRETKPRGLSLGDRCCLALAEREKLPALTADKHWAELGLGIEVKLFRSSQNRRSS